MDRRSMLNSLAFAPLLTEFASGASQTSPSYLELKTWYLQNTPENQAGRLAEYLEHGLAPALDRAGAKLQGAFGNLMGSDGPYYITLVEYPSLAGMGQTLEKLSADSAHTAAQQQLGKGAGLPFVRVESSLLRSFDVQPQVAVPSAPVTGARIFELRTYESQTFATLATKVGMFNSGESRIFQRLGMRPVFFGQTLVGPQQPNLKYMLTYESLAARDELWKSFVSDPEWKKLSSAPELKDSEIVKNIGNVLLRPLSFSKV
jgi:hypothetical protein